MVITLFGGSNGPSFQNYLRSIKRGIIVQLQKAIEDGDSQQQAYQRVKKMFIIERLSFDTKRGTITDTHTDHYHDQFKGGLSKKVFVKRYQYSIPFTGDGGLIQFRPMVFHGVNNTVTVSDSSISKPGSITAMFICEPNNQEQFDNVKNHCFNGLLENGSEINKEIEEWNNYQLEMEIKAAYPLALEEVKRTAEFEERNNIVL